MSTPEVPAPLLPAGALNNTMGCLFVGIVLAMSLWGTGCVQVYYYYNRYPGDDYRLKILVAIVWMLDTAHQGLITHTAYTYLITEYGNLEYLGIICPSLVWEVPVSASIVLLVQCFFVVRIWKLSQKNIFITAFLVVLVSAEFIVSIIYTAKALPLDTFANLTSIVSWSRAINGVGAAGDVAIAGVLIFLLNSSRTGFSKSESIINRLIIFSLNTGLLTSIWALLSLITITTLPNTFVYIMFYVTVSRLYTNSLMATLNARKGLRGHPDSSENFSMSDRRGRVVTDKFVTVNVGQPSVNYNAKFNTQGRQLSIKVDTETTQAYYNESPSDDKSGLSAVSDLAAIPYHPYKGSPDDSEETV